jgi:23S rRNA (cytidine1920-2'-O)/16S rRNA (cytidine1409-2'-O)-methyltransferase
LKERLDKILVSKGLVKSRELARAFIMEGKVFVDGGRITKAGTLVSETADILLKDADLPFVSRGGLKLEAAIDFFGVDVKDRVIIDVGASTGGFTDCLLKRGARKIYCIDVGYGQLDWSLRKDPRVIPLEKTNIRYLGEVVGMQEPRIKGPEFEDLRSNNIDIAVIDVSFISLKKVVPAVIGFLKEDAEILALVKPQFEVGKGEVGKGGIVREEGKRLEALESVRQDLEETGLETAGVFQSPVPGQKGNIEYFLYMKRRIHGRG